METQEISIPVTLEVAEAYERASLFRRTLAIQGFADSLIPRTRAEAIRDFDEARCRLSEEAQANGLTQEILDEILADEDN